MLIELVRRGELVDHTLFADTGAEKPQPAATQRFRPGQIHPKLPENIMSNANVARSLQDFKKPEIYSAVRSVLMAEAHLQLMRERVLPIQAACLANADLVANLSDRQPITKMSRVYLSTDRYAVAGLYDTYKHALRAAGGFGLSDRQIEEGCCPELIAENLLVRAQNILIELTGVIVGIEPFQLGLEPRARYLELTLGMIVSMPDFKCELLAPPAATI